MSFDGYGCRGRERGVETSATLIVTNAAVYTVDKQHPKAEAVAVIGDRIVALGSRADIDLWRGPKTKVIDAGGKLLLPGFNDAHVHFIQGGAQLEQVQLTDASTPEEFVKRIAAQVTKAPKGEWILGGRWDETKWPSRSSRRKTWWTQPLVTLQFSLSATTVTRHWPIRQR